MNRIRDSWVEIVHSLQDSICIGLEKADGVAIFKEDKWVREEGGGGKTRVISKGAVFEKGGVNTSVVFGKVNDGMRKQLGLRENSDELFCEWFASGISIVIHPLNPFVPTIHCNYRMFELYDKEGKVSERWFGGGTDLTPYYLFSSDAKHFHNTYLNICNQFDKSFYPTFKKNCDDYFVNSHRKNERRGIGGIFYDHQRPSKEKGVDFWMNFGKSCGGGFLESYLPIVNERKNMEYQPSHKFWQEIRRGRYTEFNLIHDRGTIFGLKSNGRTESILMSLPPTVRFEYDYEPKIGSKEWEVLQVLLRPINWV